MGGEMKMRLEMWNINQIITKHPNGWSKLWLHSIEWKEEGSPFNTHHRCCSKMQPSDFTSPPTYPHNKLSWGVLVFTHHRRRGLPSGSHRSPSDYWYASTTTTPHPNCGTILLIFIQLKSVRMSPTNMFPNSFFCFSFEAMAFHSLLIESHQLSPSFPSAAA